MPQDRSTDLSGGHGNGHVMGNPGAGRDEQRHPWGRYGQGSVDPVWNWEDGLADYGEAQAWQYNPLMGNTLNNAYPLPGAMQVLAYGAPAWEWPVQPYWGLRTRIHTPWPGGSSFGWIRNIGGHFGSRR